LSQSVAASARSKVHPMSPFYFILFLIYLFCRPCILCTARTHTHTHTHTHRNMKNKNDTWEIGKEEDKEKAKKKKMAPGK
jgi:hypothetical protein